MELRGSFSIDYLDDNGNVITKDEAYKKYAEAGERITRQNIAEGKYYPATNEQFEALFSARPSLLDDGWSYFYTAAQKVYDRYCWNQAMRDVVPFVNELRDLLQKYPKIRMHFGCGCCDRFDWSDGLVTYDCSHINLMVEQ